MNLKPARQRLIAKQAKSEKAGLIVLPPSSQRAELIADVVAVGQDVIDYAPGDRILFGKYAKFDVPIRGEEWRDYFIMNEDDVLCKIVD